MVWPFTPSRHQQNVEFKQRQRQHRIEAHAEYRQAITGPEKSLLSQNVETVVQRVSSGELKAGDVLKAYAKAALVSQEQTNCLTEIMFDDARKWASNAHLKGPLAGFPVSLKDHFKVAGYDSTTGYSALVGQNAHENSPLVRLLLDAGAVPYVKTNVPITMMSIDGRNDLFGRTLNPWKPTHAPGGSSQGEGALIGSRGSRIGVGTDAGGSVRIPAAWCGVYSLKFSSYRFPADIDESGKEGIRPVASPMAASWKDLKYFSDAVMGMKPWVYDSSLLDWPWVPDTALPEKVKVGVLRFREYLPPTPAVERALSTTVDALKKQGYEVVEFDLPDPVIDYDWTILKIFHADNYAGAVKPFLHGEKTDAQVSNHRRYTWWPAPLRRFFEFILNLLGFKEKAWRLRNLSPLTVSEYYEVVGRRDRLRRRVHEKWSAEKLNFLITPPHPSPALRNGSGPESFFTILYTSLWNLLDYPAGILPVSRVDSATDALPKDTSTKNLNHPTRFTYDTYDASEMHGLPLAVQVVAPRYHDEEALAAMKLVEDALHSAGIFYE